MPEQKKLNPIVDEVSRINDKQRTIRWGIVGITIFGCVWLISNAIVKIASKPEPSWLTLSLAIIAALTIGSTPSIVAWRWIGKFIKERTGRIAELEEAADPTRSSSELLQDGTLSND